MDELRHMLPLLIPIIAIAGGLAIPIVYIITQHQRRQQLLEQNHKERMAAIERGIELPPLPAELLTDRGFQDNCPPHPSRAWDAGRQLRSGLFLVFVGVALGSALWVHNGVEAAIWALIPIAAGLAKLLFYTMAPKQPAGDGPKS